MSEVLFSIRDLKQYFPSGKHTVKAVDGISFNLYRGETLSLVGESGCGKTTCARTMLGVYKPAGGSVEWKGRDILALTGRERTNFRKANQMIFQDPYSCLDPRMTIGEIIGEGIRRHFAYSSDQRYKKVLDLLGTVGLTGEFAHRFPHELSGGQRQRAGIARALALEPECLICDEPVASLDVSIQAQIINLLMDLQKERELTILMISHDLGIVRHMSNRVAVMYLGEIVETADVKTLYSEPLHPYTQALFSAIPVADPDSRWLDQRIKLKGDNTAYHEEKGGCKFFSRCRYASEKCMREKPPGKEVCPGHTVKCWKRA